MRRAEHRRKEAEMQQLDQKRILRKCGSGARLAGALCLWFAVCAAASAAAESASS